MQKIFRDSDEPKAIYRVREIFPPIGPNVGSAQKRREQKRLAEQRGTRNIYRTPVEEARKQLLKRMREGTDKDELMVATNKLVDMQTNCLMESHRHLSWEAQELLIPGFRKLAAKYAEDEIWQATFDAYERCCGIRRECDLAGNF